MDKHTDSRHRERQGQWQHKRFAFSLWRPCCSKRYRKSHERISIDDLKKVFILKELRGNDSFLHTLLGYCRFLNVPQGTTIYHEGDHSDELYIILAGSVRIYKKTSSGEPFLLAELHGKSGSFFGEMGLIHSQERSATVETRSKVRLLVLSRRNFIRMARKQPAIAMGLTFAICRVLSERLRRSSADLAYLYDALVYEASEL